MGKNPPTPEPSPTHPPSCTAPASLLCSAPACPARAEQYGEMCSAGVLGGHLARMGAALGMTTVPLTPGGSELLLPDEAEPPPPPPPEAALELLPPEDEEGGQQPSPAAVPGGGDVTAAL